MRRTLVIGGTLFIGKALVRRLLERGDDVTILHRGAENPFAGQTREIRCDRNDSEAVSSALAGEDFEVVFDNVYDWARGTTASQVEAAARACGDGLERYVFMSSIAAYGTGLDHTEDDPLAPPDDPDSYCRNKADTERMLLGSPDIPAVTLRPPYIYGPENPFEREQFFWDRLTAGRPIIVPGDGSRLMQFVLVDDLVDAALPASENGSGAYNIANPTAVTQSEVVRALAAAAGVEARMELVSRERLEALGGGQLEPPYYFGQYFDMPPISQVISKARRELGFEPTPFGEGLRRTFEWYQSSERAAPDFSFDDRVLGGIIGTN